MHSAASITDFDSDEDNYPFYDSGIGITRSSNGNSSSSSSSSDTLESQSCRVDEFGKFEDNYGWIQCQSKSYPDRVYYYNTWSRCKTWYRPVSRYADIPFVSIRRQAKGDTLESVNNLELMSVSDDERELKISKRVAEETKPARDCDDVSDIIARYYYTSQMIPDTNDLRSSINASDCYRKKDQADVSDENDVGDSPLYAPDFVETEFFVGNAEKTDRIFDSLLKDNTANVPSFQSGRVRYGVPRLKRIGLHTQLIKPKRMRVVKSRKKSGPRKIVSDINDVRKSEPRKIVSDMYGVRTISYDLPELNHVCAAVGVKTSTLSASDSDSDANVPPSPSRHPKTTRLFESEWHGIKNLHQPLLSDSSSSPSSRSDTTTSSNTSRSTGSSSSSSSSSSSCSSSCSCSRRI